LKVINLTNTSKLKVDNDIKSICGGISVKERWINRFAHGVGGFAYRDPSTPEDEYVYKTNLAFYAKGLGIYCSNHYANYVILIPENEIEIIEIVKESTRLKSVSLSLYKFLVKLGMNPINAENYLTPAEIIEDNLPHVMIKTPETFFKLDMVSISVTKLASLFKKSNLNEKVKLNVSAATVG
jgi:hypothetical protein